MNFQYVHSRNYGFLNKLQPTGGNTYFLDTPTKSQILHLFDHDDPTIRLGYGEVKCHFRDNYNRRIGREMALSRAQTKNFRLEEVRFVGKKQNFYLQSDELKRVIVLEASPNSNKLYFRGIV